VAETVLRIEVSVCGVNAGSGRSAGSRMRTASGDRPASSILPTPVQWAGSLRPTAETIRTDRVLSTFAM